MRPQAMRWARQAGVAGCLVAGLCCALLLLIAPRLDAKAPEPPAMTVSLVRSNVPGCEPTCPQWIAAEGRITATTPALFRKILKLAGKRRFPVIIDSPGGDVRSAMAIGRLLRARGLDVAIGRSYFSDCAPGQKGCSLPKHQKGVYRGRIFAAYASCASACTLILASGKRRIHSDGASVGVHQITTRVTPERVLYRERYRIVKGQKRLVSRVVVKRRKLKAYDTTKLSRSFRKMLRGYLNELGVDPELLALYEKAGPQSILWLTSAQTREVRLATNFFDAKLLSEPQQCQGNPAPHCVPAPPAP